MSTLCYSAVFKPQAREFITVAFSRLLKKQPDCSGGRGGVSDRLFIEVFMPYDVQLKAFKRQQFRVDNRGVDSNWLPISNHGVSDTPPLNITDMQQPISGSLCSVLANPSSLEQKKP